MQQNDSLADGYQHPDRAVAIAMHNNAPNLKRRTVDQMDANVRKVSVADLRVD